MSLRDQFAVKPGTKVKLDRVDPDCTGDFDKKAAAQRQLEKNISRLAELQYLLYAENRRALLIILQAMDAGGKDGTIRHVMSGVNPQGCTVTPFKVPSAEEADHDYLWRIHNAVPSKGKIGIFNRSHYEDILVVRVHKLVPRSVWSKRFAQVNAFERTLVDNDVTILKFFLYISSEEQRKRLNKRLRDPGRLWKVDPADFEERKLWDEYMKAYEDALTECSTAWAPWFIIPANTKWFRNLAVSQIIVDTLEDMNMEFPKPGFDPAELIVE